MPASHVAGPGPTRLVFETLHGFFPAKLSAILKGVLEMKQKARHPLLNPDTPISLITGGGPGVMEVGNRVARKLNILSCANIVDFRGIEQEQNPYIDAKMTYRIDDVITGNLQRTE